MTICHACHNKVNAWVDYYQDAGPIREWRQLRGNLSPDVFTARVNDRAALIRQQVALIRDQCAAQHQQLKAAA